MVHLSTLEDDFYILNSQGTKLVGRRRRKTYTLDQRVRVQVERVDRFKRQIDFRIVEISEKKDSKQNVRYKPKKDSKKSHRKRQRPG